MQGQNIGTDKKLNTKPCSNKYNTARKIMQIRRRLANLRLKKRWLAIKQQGEPQIYLLILRTAKHLFLGNETGLSKKKNAWLENSTTNANLFVNVTDSKASLFRKRNRSFKTTLLGGSRVTMYAHLFRRHDQVIDRMMKRLPNHNHIVFLSDGSILLFWKLYNPMYRIRFQIRF